MSNRPTARFFFFFYFICQIIDPILSGSKRQPYPRFWLFPYSTMFINFCKLFCLGNSYDYHWQNMHKHPWVVRRIRTNVRHVPSWRNICFSLLGHRDPSTAMCYNNAYCAILTSKYTNLKWQQIRNCHILQPVLCHNISDRYFCFMSMRITPIQIESIHHVPMPATACLMSIHCAP